MSAPSSDKVDLAPLAHSAQDGRPHQTYAAHVAEERGVAIPRLASLYPQFKGREIEVELNGNVEREAPEGQLALVLAETAPRYGKAPRTVKK